VNDRLRPLWDFADLDSSESRLRSQLAVEESKGGRAEVLTQLARVEGLRGNFEAGERLIQEAEELAGQSAVARARIGLERGRLLRSSGDAEAAFPHFKGSFSSALEAGELFIAVDAAHMVALAASDREGFLEWTNRGIELAENAEPSVRYWLGPLLNNLGWHYYENGELEPALEAFERALAERERDPENREAIELALYSVARTLRALARPADGLPLLERSVSSAEVDGRSDGWLHEELAETYTALGREGDAREHAEKALALLPDADPEFTAGGKRAERLHRMVAEAAHGP
jgi:tetratricopeptide (TPR) repeat protein